jgi:S-adenosylmethionine synthetase
MRYLFTSESVSGGHPDKLCDYVSDSILDACLQIDPDARVACETASKGNMIMILGEISCNGQVNYEQVIRNAAKELGYDSWDIGLDYKTCQVIVSIDTQSREIGGAVHQNKTIDEIGAGDQGFMMGYATKETEELMPLSHVLATKLLKKLDDMRLSKVFSWARPDAKSQVTVEYEEKNGFLTPIRVHTVLMSIQHSPDVSAEQIREEVKAKLIHEVIPEKYLTAETKFIINPSNSFTIGGPRADAGVTGRKIIVDSYGGWGGHGGKLSSDCRRCILW